MLDPWPLCTTRRVTANRCRVEERHAAELERDPLDDLREAIRRSAGKHLAIDQVEQPPPSTLDQGMTSTGCER